MEIEWPKLIEEALALEGSMGDTFCRFRNYSFLNQLLLRMQGVREPVATYKVWQGLGRQVLRGSVAKEIIRPITVKRREVDGEDESTFTRFKAVRCIFGLSETEGPELPAVEIPAWDLERALEALEVQRVPFAQLNGNIQGYATGRQLAINPLAVDPLLTTFHELSHIVSGHTTAGDEGQTLHRGLREFEAEGAAYLAGNELRVLSESQASESRAYLQGWLRGETPPDVSIRRVFSSTDKILKAGRIAVAA